jgi:hypothetical protein
LPLNLLYAGKRGNVPPFDCQDVRDKRAVPGAGAEIDDWEGPCNAKCAEKGGEEKIQSNVKQKLPSE